MKIKYFLLLISTFAAGVSVVWWNTITVEKISRSIEAELPRKASVAQVESFLDAHEISSSKILYSTSDGNDFYDNPKLDGKRPQIKKQMQAIIRDTERGLLFSSGILLSFYFDEQGNLVEYTARGFSTGP